MKISIPNMDIKALTLIADGRDISYIWVINFVPKSVLRRKYYTYYKKEEIAIYSAKQQDIISWNKASVPYTVIKNIFLNVYTSH